MAKKRAKTTKKSKTKKSPPTSQNTIHVLVPDSIHDLDEDRLKSLAHVIAHAGELSLGAPPHAEVQHLKIIKTSEVEEEVAGFKVGWHKSIADGC